MKPTACVTSRTVTPMSRSAEPSCRRRITRSGTRSIRYPVSRRSNLRSIVHAPELERAAPSALELDDHIQLLPVLRAEIVLRDLPATRDLPLDHEIVALPVALDLDVPASVHELGDLPAVVVEYQRRAAVRREREARISLDDRECGRCIEHELHGLVHPLALLVAHPSPAALTAATPAAEARAAASAKAATTSSHAGVSAAPASTCLVAGRVSALEHVPRVVALRGIESPVAGEIRVRAAERDHSAQHDCCHQLHRA